MNSDFLERNQVLKYLRISAPTLYRWMERRGFPRPLRPGARRRIWRRSEIDAWLEGTRKT